MNREERDMCALFGLAWRLIVSKGSCENGKMLTACPKDGAFLTKLKAIGF
jgi:hypothetical protein